ncbi:flagellar assembly protein FliH [Idiomarina aquatica]|uniref:Flagellar assembly protein FliH n=1 Tax=Idiomarina aquatica TaxID=1327752 RepID=A0AA94JCW1_9GAMM|nr:flagellar assembly protein FliH [Idiomarina aquatica]RUO42605.1 flagellar assembly protein FliH [Idiomarina aquatica]
MSDGSNTTEKWQFPDITSEEFLRGEKTNALNKPRRWQYEPPEADDDEEQELQPLTAEELEQIREAAREEGFKEGYNAGHAEGLEAGHQEGVEQGQQDGFNKGFEQGLADGKAKMEQQAGELLKLLDSLSHPEQKITDDVEAELLEMVMQLTEAICLDVPYKQPELVKVAVRNALEVLPVTDQRVVIHLNPDDLELVQDMYSEEQLREHGWLLNKDDLLERGGCRVTTESSSVDYTLRSRIKSVFDKLKG